MSFKAEGCPKSFSDARTFDRFRPVRDLSGAGRRVGRGDARSEICRCSVDRYAAIVIARTSFVWLVNAGSRGWQRAAICRLLQTISYPPLEVGTIGRLCLADRISSRLQNSFAI